MQVADFFAPVGDEGLELRWSINARGEKVLRQELGTDTDDNKALACRGRGPFADVDSLGLGPHQQRRAVPAQRLLPAYRERHVSRELEIELHQAVAGDEFDPGVLVGEIGDHDVNVVADSGEVPIAFAFVGRQGDAGRQ